MIGALAFAGLVVVGWLLTGWLRLAGWLRPGDARKVNHVAVLVGGACWFGWQEPADARTGSLTAGLILLPLVALTCRLRRWPPFSWAFAGNTRPSDAPHEAFYFWSSWLVGFVGLFAIEAALADVRVTRLAALILGVGDGLGEPVGTRWGRHRYRVPGWLGWSGGERSLEGSLAVALGTAATILLAVGWVATPAYLAAVVGVAAVVTLAEALSPRGLDNLTVPLAAAGALVLVWPVLI